jgi:hypothetical protein
MPPEKTPETSEDILKEIQGAEVETSPDKEEETEDRLAFELPDETEEETEELEAEETSEEEETEAAEEKEEAKPELIPIKVDGKTEYVTQEQLVQYAQKGRFLEQERAKDKGEKEPELDEEKLEKMFMGEVKRRGKFFPVVLEGVKMAVRAELAQEREGRKEARGIADSSEWGKDGNYRNEFNALLDEGVTPSEAGLKISAKYWEEKAIKGEEIGEKKAKAKEAVKMPKGKEVAPDARESKGEASVMQEYNEALAAGKPSSELLKIMRKGGVPMGKDTI